MLGGYRSPADLAEAIGRAGFGERTVRNVEQGKRTLADYEAGWVAEACGISPAFFEIDLAALQAPNLTRAAEATQVELLEAALALARARERDEQAPGEQDQRGRGEEGRS